MSMTINARSLPPEAACEMIILTASSGGVAAYSSAGSPGCVALSSFATIRDL
jgi:hypothetical protein